MVSTHLKNISQNGNLPEVGVKIKKMKPPTSIPYMDPIGFNLCFDIVAFPEDLLLEALDQRAAKASTSGERLQNHPQHHVVSI